MQDTNTKSDQIENGPILRFESLFFIIFLLCLYKPTLGRKWLKQKSKILTTFTSHQESKILKDDYVTRYLRNVTIITSCTIFTDKTCFREKEYLRVENIMVPNGFTNK